MNLNTFIFQKDGTLCQKLVENLIYLKKSELIGFLNRKYLKVLK